jgi:hypothetical protein
MGAALLVLAMHSHLRVVTRGNDRPESGPRFFCFPKRGKRSTERCGGLRLLPGKSGRELHPLPGTAPAFMTKAGHLSVLHDRIDGSCLPPRPGPALPGITGCKREVCTPSPAPVQRAPRSPDTRWTGMMPRPPANRSDEPPSAEPAPAPSKAVAADDVPHDKRAELPLFITARSCQGI